MPMTVITPDLLKSAARVSWTSANWAVGPPMCPLAAGPNAGGGVAEHRPACLDRRERAAAVGVAGRGQVEAGRGPVRGHERVDARPGALAPSSPVSVVGIYRVVARGWRTRADSAASWSGQRVEHPSASRLELLGARACRPGSPGRAGLGAGPRSGRRAGRRRRRGRGPRRPTRSSSSERAAARRRR